MDISDEVFVATMREGTVFYFINDDLDSEEPHYHVILNKSLDLDPVVFFSIATSKIEKRKKNHEILGYREETLVIVSPEESCGILKVESAFDCNTCKYRPVQEVSSMFNEGRIKVKGTMSVDIIKKLRKGVLMSDQIADWLKDLII
jgi:hypothetical protein